MYLDARSTKHKIFNVVCKLSDYPTLNRNIIMLRLLLKCDGTRAETRFCLSAKRTSPFKSAGASLQSTTGSRGVRISGSNGSTAGYTLFQMWCEGYCLPTPFASFPFTSPPCVTVFHHVSTGHYRIMNCQGSASKALVAYWRVLLCV